MSIFLLFSGSGPVGNVNISKYGTSKINAWLTYLIIQHDWLIVWLYRLILRIDMTSKKNLRGCIIVKLFFKNFLETSKDSPDNFFLSIYCVWALIHHSLLVLKQQRFTFQIMRLWNWNQSKDLKNDPKNIWVLLLEYWSVVLSPPKNLRVLSQELWPVEFFE